MQGDAPPLSLATASLREQHRMRTYAYGDQSTKIGVRQRSLDVSFLAERPGNDADYTRYEREPPASLIPKEYHIVESTTTVRRPPPFPPIMCHFRLLRCAHVVVVFSVCPGAHRTCRRRVGGAACQALPAHRVPQHAAVGAPRSRAVDAAV